jgi:hypothetical protein
VTFSFSPVNAWPPRTEEALEAAAKAGHLEETHVLELKRELASGDAANKELAADVASLAIDGGLLIIGVDEKAGPGLTPVPLDGLPERVEQVARTRIDEPLPLTFAQVTSTAQRGSGLGYLLVRVPGSPRAPHMVGHHYWGRGDKTKYQLSDAEVERLMALRGRWAADTEQALRDWMAADPIAPGSQENGHLFVFASPVPQRERLLLPVFSGEWTSVFRRLVDGTSHAGSSFVPDMPDYLTNFSTTPDGWAWSSYAVFGERLEGQAGAADRENRALMVEICENGQLRLVCGRAAEKAPTWSGSTFFLIDALVLGLTARMVSLAGLVSHAAGFMGSWDFGVGLTGLRDSRAYSRTELAQFAGLPGPAYTQDTYTNTTRASVTEIEAGTGAVVERLLGRLMRAVGADRITSVKKHFGEA